MIPEDDTGDNTGQFADDVDQDGVDIQWVNYQSKRYEPNKGKNQGREPASEFSFHKVEKWQKYFWRMIFSSTTFVSYFEE